MELRGKVAIVTGGASGIGLAIVELLLANKCKVCFCDVNSEEGKTVEQRLRDEHSVNEVIFKNCDVAKKDKLEELFLFALDKYKHLDILYNNAAIVDENKDWRYMIDVNLTAMIQGTYLAFQYMDTNNGGDGGVIINTSSGAGYFTSKEIEPVYGATKHGIKAFTQNVGMTSQQMYGVRVNCFCPGATQTALLAKVLDSPSTYLYGPNVDGIQQIVPEMMSPQLVARATLPLLRDESYNGHCIMVYPQGVACIPPVLDTTRLQFTPHQ